MARATTVPKVTFHDLGDQRAILDQFLEESEGEETPEIAALWDALQGDATTKAANWWRYTVELQTQGKVIEGIEAALKKALDRYASERKAVEARVKASRAELSRQMLRFGIDTVKVPGVSIWHVDEEPVVQAPDLTELRALDNAFGGMLPYSLDRLAEDGLVTHTPAAVTVVETPERYEWNREALVARARATLDAPEVPAPPFPEGVTVTFRRGIRGR